MLGGEIVQQAPPSCSTTARRRLGSPPSWETPTSWRAPRPGVGRHRRWVRWRSTPSGTGAGGAAARGAAPAAAPSPSAACRATVELCEYYGHDTVYLGAARRWRAAGARTPGRSLVRRAGWPSPTTARPRRPRAGALPPCAASVSHPDPQPRRRRSSSSERAPPGPVGRAWPGRAGRRHEVTRVERADAVGAGGLVRGGRACGSTTAAIASTPATAARILGGSAGCWATISRSGPATGAFGCSAGGWRSRSAPATCCGLPRPGSRRAGRDAAVGPLRRPRADTFAEVVRAGLGPAVLDAFYGPYARKLWARPRPSWRASLARRRVSAGGASRGAWCSPPDPPAGCSSIPAAVGRSPRRSPRRGRRRRRPAAGCGVRRCGATTTARAGGRPDDGGPWTQRRSGRPHRCRRSCLLDPAAPDDAGPAAGRLRHRAVVLVYLVLAQRRWTEFDAHYFPSPTSWRPGCPSPGNYRDDADDPTDRTVLCAEVPCGFGDEIWPALPARWPIDWSAELAALGLPPIRPCRRGGPPRLPRVYPVYRPGFTDRPVAPRGLGDGALA